MTHQFLQFLPPKPARRVIHDISVRLMNQYFGVNFSRTQWLKQPTAVVHCYQDETDEQGRPCRKTWDSVPIRLVDFERHIEEKLSFDYKVFELFDPKCPWLDGAFNLGAGFPGVILESSMPYGPSFPVKPKVAGEGRIILSLQSTLQGNILRLRRELINRSCDFLTNEWFDLLRMFFADCVSLIDVTLHQIYAKAQFDLPSEWTFNIAKLGPRHGRRMSDKLRWIGLITGRSLDDARAEVCALDMIRKLRNHVQHFDPPCFAFTLEEVAAWLNQAPKIGRLAWKIRDRLRSPLNTTLVELVVAPDVAFVPKDGRPRVPHGDGVGHVSTCWPPGFSADET